MALLTAQNIAQTGLTATFSAVNSSDTVAQPTDQRLFLEVLNGGGGSINVTIPAQTTTIQNGMGGTVTISDMVVAVGAGVRKHIGPFPPAYVNSSGLVTINYSGTTTVTAAVIKLPRVPA